MLSLEGPDDASLNQTVQLHCRYEIRNDRLYDVKWFLNSREFYRYNGGKNNYEKQAFPGPLEVHVSYSHIDHFVTIY